MWSDQGAMSYRTRGGRFLTSCWLFWVSPNLGHLCIKECTEKSKKAVKKTKAPFGTLSERKTLEYVGQGILGPGAGYYKVPSQFKHISGEFINFIHRKVLWVCIPNLAFRGQNSVSKWAETGRPKTSWWQSTTGRLLSNGRLVKYKNWSTNSKGTFIFIKM